MRKSAWVIAVAALMFGGAASAKIALNKLAANELSANKLAANKLAANKLAANKLGLIGHDGTVDLAALQRLANNPLTR